MAQDYRVVYQGRLRRGQRPSGVASRLSEALGRDRATLEKLLSGPEKILLCTASARQAQRLTEIFTEAGAEMRLERPGDASPPPAHAPRATPSVNIKPAVPPSFGQRIWLIRAASVLLALTAVVGVGFGLLVTALVALLFSYSWVLERLPWPAVVLPVYVSLVAALLLIVAGLIKPFVRVESHRPRTIKLKRANEPELFEFIDHICELLHVPYPRAVLVDMSPTVQAGTAPGAELTIGLPLLANATTAELGGLVARALTLHISGTSGKLGRFVVSALQRLHGAVYGRDRLDGALQHAAQTDHRILAHAAREGIILLQVSRRILGGILKEAIGTSAAAMQAIEWHRDRHQARITGTEHFAQSLRLTRLVGFTTDRAEAAVRDLLQKEKPLPADLPAILALRLHALTREQSTEHLLTVAESEQETVPQFHVPDATRIERLRKSTIEPALTCATAARRLVRGFPLLARSLTLRYYRNQLNLPVTSLQLQSLPTAEQRVLEQLTGGAYLDVMFLNPRRFAEPGKTAAELMENARRLKAAVQTSSEQARKSITRYKEVEQCLLAVQFEELTLRAGRSSRSARIALEAVQTRCRALEEDLEKAYAGSTTHGELVSRYLANGMALLGHPDTASRLAKAPELAAQTTALFDALDKIQQQIGALRELRLHASLLELLLTESPTSINSTLKDRIAEQEADIQSRLTAIRISMKRVRNPLNPNTSLFEHARAGWAPTTASHALLDEAQVIQEGILRLKERMVARLATLVDIVPS